MKRLKVVRCGTSSPKPHRSRKLASSHSNRIKALVWGKSRKKLAI